MDNNKSRSILVRMAQEIAKEYGHSEVTLEHLLVALISQDNYFTKDPGFQGVFKNYLEDSKNIIEELEEYLSGPDNKISTVGGVTRLGHPVEKVLNKMESTSFDTRGSLDFNGIEALHEITRETGTLVASILAQQAYGLNELHVGDVLEIYNRRNYPKKPPEPKNPYNDKAELDEDGDEMAGPAKGKKKAKKVPALKAFGRDITADAKAGKLDPLIGRSEEMGHVDQILLRKTKNNPVLLGEAGVGKTAMAEGVAQRMVSGEIPGYENSRLISLDLALMVAGTKYRGQFEERMKAAINEAEKSDVVLFIDELHTMVGAGSAEGTMDAANILKPALARGEITVIGATTLKEYRKYIEKDAGLVRRFQPVVLDPPSVDETIEILKGRRRKFEEHHSVKITDEAIEAAAKLSERYITDRNQPDKSLDLVDEAGSRARLEVLKLSPEEQVHMAEITGKIEECETKKAKAAKDHKFDTAARKREQISKLKKEREAMIAARNQKVEDVDISVTVDTIGEVISKITGIPLQKMNEEEKVRLLRLEEELGEKVIGQEKAVKAVSEALIRSRADLSDPNRPRGKFLFTGSTGVGKTLICKALAEIMFGSKDELISLDMSEYMEKSSVARLIGSPPGYVGHEEGGQLTEQVRRKPYSVVLFDEIEKADPSVLNMLLQILEEGRLTDSLGKKVDFTNTVVIMTSNIGSHHVHKKGSSMSLSQNNDGDDITADQWKTIENKIMGDVKKTLKAELLNRLDDTITFGPLNKEHMHQVIDCELKDLCSRLAGMNITIEFNEEAKNFLVNEGHDSELGARPLRRAIERYVETPLSKAKLRDEFGSGYSISVTTNGKEKEEEELAFAFNEEVTVSNDNLEPAEGEPELVESSSDSSPSLQIGS